MGRWRIGTPACSSSPAAVRGERDQLEGTDLRPGRYTDLAALVQTESDQYDALEGKVKDLNADVANLASSVKGTNVKRFQRKVETKKDAAGLTPRSGPGVTITLSDAPEDVINSTSQNLNLLVVHQQDIQAVVNAMWKGGAEAVTVQGQRIITTTGIKCEGNSVQLQGIPYPQPYVIQGVGDQTAILDAIENDDYLEIYREQADQADISVGWQLDTDDQATAPAYDGLLDITHAEPVR